MPFVSVSLPPGMLRTGTLYDSRGRWYDGNLVRWVDEKGPQPVGGFSLLTGAGSAAVGGAVRGMLAWRRNNGTVYVALGTRNALKVYSAGTLSDIGPGDLVAGATNASGSYYSRVEANTWQMDAYGEDLVACSYADGRILYWDSSAGVGTDAAALAGAPTSCKGVLVTPERFVVALAASGDGRLVKWSDQENATSWTPATTNQAGDFTLATKGQIQAGRAAREGALIWTDVDLWTMSYIGGDLVYGFRKVGDECGAIGRRAMGFANGVAYWWGARGFFAYDGFVRPLPCAVGDFVLNRLSREQASKVACVPNTDFNEVTWHYPSGGGDNDSYVTYNYALGQWYTGAISRSDGIDRQFLEYPLASDTSGAIFEHEKGTTHQNEAGATAYTPYVETGPLDLQNGDGVVMVRQMFPDEETLGEVDVRVLTRMHPTGSETTNGPYTLTNPTDIRATGRYVRLRFTQATGGFRVGTFQLDLVPAGRR